MISKSINNRYGVMQGGVLSPKLFNEFPQDLKNYLNPKFGLKIGDLYLAYLLFAVDIVLFSEFAHQIYAKHSFSFTLGETALEIVDNYKYLVLWCNNKKNIFVKNHSYLAEQARKAIFTILLEITVTA